MEGPGGPAEGLPSAGGNGPSMAGIRCSIRSRDSSGCTLDLPGPDCCAGGVPSPRMAGCSSPPTSSLEGAASCIFPDDEGRIRVTPYDFRERPTDRFHLFDPESRYLGEVRNETPVAPYPIEFHDGHLYGVTRVEFDVPYVVRLRIQGR